MNAKRRSLLTFETSSVLLNLFIFLIWAKIGGRGGGCTAIYANNRYIYPYMDEKCRPLVWDRVLFMSNLSVV